MVHHDQTHWRRHGALVWGFPSGHREPAMTTCDECGWTWRTGWQEPACTCTLPRQRVPFPEVEAAPVPPAMEDEKYAGSAPRCSCAAHIFYTLLAVAAVAVLAKFQGWI